MRRSSPLLDDVIEVVVLELDHLVRDLSVEGRVARASQAEGGHGPTTPMTRTSSLLGGRAEEQGSTSTWQNVGHAPVEFHGETRTRRRCWHDDYRLPERLGAGQITVRLHNDASDAARKFNRTENVRPIPATDPDFRDLSRRRNDAESINRGLDDSLWLRRAHSVGHRRQLLNLIGYAVMVNALTVARHRHAVPLAA